MSHRLTLAVLIPALLFGGAALAADNPGEAPVATSAKSTEAISTGAMSTDDQIAAYLRDLPPATSSVSVADAYGAYVPYDDRRPHGEFGVGVGNHGYRSLYARQTLPVGQTGTLDIAVAHDQFNARGWGKQSSTGLAVSLDFSKPADRCAVEAPPWRREVELPAGCVAPLQRSTTDRR